MVKMPHLSNFFKEGLGYLKARKTIFLFGVASIIPAIVTNFYNIVLPPYVIDAINADSVVFGISDMFYGIGGLASGFLMSMIAKKLSNKWAILLFFIFSSLNLFILFLNTSAFVLFIGSLVFGFLHSGVRIVMNSQLMTQVNPQYMGRATSVWSGISLLINAAGASFLGVMMDVTHARIGFLVMSSLMAVGFLFILGLFSQFKKHIDRDVKQ